MLKNRIEMLREKLDELFLDGFLVPMSDEYQNEYVPPSARRIEFLSGFSGSNAFIIVLKNRAAFFTDNRYTVQARRQVPKSIYAVYDLFDKSPHDWLKENVRAGAKIGFDARLHTVSAAEKWNETLEKTGIVLVIVKNNPVDAIWEMRPEPSAAPIIPHELKYAGRESANKIEDLTNILKQENVDAAVITDPESVAWLLNVRGSDVPHNPLPLSSMIVYGDSTVQWFVDEKRITEKVSSTLPASVRIMGEETFVDALREIGSKMQVALVDKDHVSFSVFNELSKSRAHVKNGANPCLLPKAIKNPTEIEGAINAHRRDGAALVKLLAWIDDQYPGYTVSEIDVAEKLESFRVEGALYRGPSFDTIAGTGPNSAVVHYHATPETNRMLSLNSFLLIDCGGQYLDGTTDVTRTVVIGNVHDEMRDRFTRVLKGNIALSSARFPDGTSGADLEAFARQHLWAAGLDYGHGTGHGVGSYLGVHEGPQAFSRRSKTALKPGMILSNEPGYYKENNYGIRIENLQLVVDVPEISKPSSRFYGFKTLTLAPIDKRAIMVGLLSNEEKTWLNAYHAHVLEELKLFIKDSATLKWLENATAPI